MVKLVCALVGVKGSPFPIDIPASELVGDLKDAIWEKNKKRIHCDAAELQLFLAKKGDAWLPSSDPVAQQLGEGNADDADVKNMIAGDEVDTTWSIQEWLDEQQMTGEHAPKRSRQIHVLVVIPPQEQPQVRLWLVRGSIENALNTNGVRCRLYRLAASSLGYYDPARRTGDQDKAFWYEGSTLQLHVLFETKEKALLFENALRDERLTFHSPLNGQVITATVAQVVQVSNQLRRIFFDEYHPQETESPQDTMSSISTNTSIVDVMTDEFKYQRIESETWFGPLGKAQSCHLMSREHCRKFASYHKYDNDKSNRLALSAEMHGWYDGTTTAEPVMNISVESVSARPVNENRYQVNLIIRALDNGYAKLISMRLKEGFAVSEDDERNKLMRTSVYVENPKVFRECMEWKHRQIAKRWAEYRNMASAVD